MNPAILGALLSFGPSLLSGLFGDPRKKLMRQATRLGSPENLGRLSNQYYQQQLASPAFSQAQGAIATGANQASNQVAQSLAQRGIGTTGTAAVLSGLTPSLVGSQQAGLRSSAYQTAQGQAQQNIDRQIQMLLGTAGPSQTQQYLAGGLEAFLPYLMSLFGNRPGLPNQALANAAGQAPSWTGLTTR